MPSIPIVSNEKLTKALGNPFNSSIKNPVSNAIQGFFTISYACFTFAVAIYFISSLLGSSNS